MLLEKIDNMCHDLVSDSLVWIHNLIKLMLTVCDVWSWCCDCSGCLKHARASRGLTLWVGRGVGEIYALPCTLVMSMVVFFAKG